MQTAERGFISTRQSCTCLKAIIVLIYCFLGQLHVTDYSNASSTGMFDPFIVSVQHCLHLSEVSILGRCPPKTGVPHRKGPP